MCAIIKICKLVPYFLFFTGTFVLYSKLSQKVDHISLCIFFLGVRSLGCNCRCVSSYRGCSPDCQLECGGARMMPNRGQLLLILLYLIFVNFLLIFLRRCDCSCRCNGYWINGCSDCYLMEFGGQLLNSLQGL